jgi:hypothetical protein
MQIQGECCALVAAVLVAEILRCCCCYCCCCCCCYRCTCTKRYGTVPCACSLPYLRTGALLPRLPVLVDQTDHRPYLTLRSRKPRWLAGCSLATLPWMAATILYSEPSKRRTTRSRPNMPSSAVSRPGATYRTLLHPYLRKRSQRVKEATRSKHRGKTIQGLVSRARGTIGVRLGRATAAGGGWMGSPCGLYAACGVALVGSFAPSDDAIAALDHHLTYYYCHSIDARRPSVPAGKLWSAE